MGYWDVDFSCFVLFASCVGFVVGLIAGAMLAAWACLSIFTQEFPLDGVLFVSCMVLSWMGFLFGKTAKRKARDGAETLSWGDKLLYFLLGSSMCWLISSYLVK